MKTQQCGFRTGPAQTELYKRRRRLEAEIFYLKSRGIVTLLSMEEIKNTYYPCSKNKGAGQIRSYSEAELRLCFCICKMLVFS